MSARHGDSDRSRYETLEAAGLPDMMPPLDAGEDMIALARAVGWCGHTGMGLVPITAQEVMAWCVGTGEALTHWQFDVLLRLSAAYVAGWRSETAPWQPTVVKMALATAGFGAADR